MHAFVIALFACTGSTPADPPAEPVPEPAVDAEPEAPTDEPEIEAEPTEAIVATHCGAEEQVVFSCELSEKPGKVVSLCASKEVTADAGSMTYRFGDIGSPELVYPDAPTHPTKAFSYNTESPAPRMSSSSWSFEREGHTYVVSDAFFHGEQTNELTVRLPDASSFSWLCRQPNTNNFGALYKLFEKT